MRLKLFRAPALRVAAVPIEVDRHAELPRVLWIELTSRCPFDCVFCSRKLLRGAGEHMDFTMYQRLIGELRDPQTIRLNYSGESAHYPKIVEACELAARTGAGVELVSALAALPAHRLEALAHSGLTQLTVSLHTLDAAQFEAIYGFSSIVAMRERIERVVSLATTAPRPLQVDLAFVAMRRNLDQLDAVAAYAASLGLQRLAVHPVIRRDPIAETFPDELDQGRLRPEFLVQLRESIDRVRRDHPALTIESSTPELEADHELGHEPRYFPGPLPAAARIHSCDQNPWETVHILADGRVVSCEERDRIELGNLRRQSLREIWHGDSYRHFRAAYTSAADLHCRRCPYKQAYLPAALSARFLASGEGETCLLDGWYSADASGVRWSQPRARLQLAAQGQGWLQLRGLLPCVKGKENTLRLVVNGVLLETLQHNGAGLKSFELRRHIHCTDRLRVEFQVVAAYCPAEQGAGPDTRRLGFALIEAAWTSA
ncbi:MAG: radical SAM protein [Tahibacter sp.]